MGYRWKPSASQKRTYHERMVAIETIKDEVPDLYNIGCTGNCCTGDEIAFFNAGKTSERIYGKIIAESYGQDKQQHTFTIEVEGDKMLIKGRNLYKNGVLRKSWKDEKSRKITLEEKYERGNIARKIANDRKINRLFNEYL